MSDMTLTEAAKWAGVTRPTIFKALKSGKLSGQKDDAGEWRIDPAELERVYQPGKPGNVSGNTGLSVPDIAETIAAKDREIALLQDALTDARTQRDRAMELATSQVRLLTTHQQEQEVATAPRMRLRLGWFRWPRNG